jgi:sugar transferase (PEP-CTERM/EpsH1 system associated)
MAAAFLRGMPLSLGYFHNTLLHGAVRAEHAAKSFDAVIAFSSSMAQYAEGLDRTPRIMDFCDVDSRKWEALAREASGVRRRVYRYECRTLLAYERKVAATFDASCVVSENEARLFRELIPGVPVRVLENGVDADYFGALPRRPDGVRIVFTGVMDYAPNVEAVSFFADRVWGRIRQAHPHARFAIVGARPVKSVRDLGRLPGVEVTGYVPDIRPHLASATVSVAPLAVARGVQNKVLEAMAAGVPVLTTADVAKGLPAGAESLVSTARREAEAFAGKLLELVGDEAARERLAAQAQGFIRGRCTWEARLQTLDALLAEVVR